MLNIPEKKILITGAAGDIGRYVASGFAKQNWLVIGLDKVKPAESEANGNLIFHQCDLVNFTETEKLLEELIKEYGIFDAVVNCAGMIANAPLVGFSDGNLVCHNFDLWNAVITSNLYTTFNVTAVMVKNMMKVLKKGVIINISSVCANGNAGQVAYSSAKAGINGLTRALSKELGAFGIRVVGIAPGYFDTPSTQKNVPEAKLNSIVKAVPLKKLGNPADLLKTLNYIIECDYINGKIIELDGGLVI